MSVGWGIIGAGNHADRTVAPALNSTSNTKIVAVCGNNIEPTREFATKHGAERAYDSLEKMLGDPELDVLFITTPNGLHAQQAIQAAEAGKHVICAKPMALTVSDGELMIEACDKNKVKLGVCYAERYHPASLEARRLVQSGIAGDVNVVKAQTCHGFPQRALLRGWRGDPVMAGAGALYGTGVHPIDLLRFILDSEIEEVLALTDEEPPKYPVDNMVYVIIKFTNGSCGTIIAGMIAPRSDNDLVFYGSKAKITCKGTLGRSPQGDLGQLLVNGDSVNVTMTFPIDNPSTFRMVQVIEDFNNWVEGGTEPLISGYNGLQMVRISNAILESSRKGKAVRITTYLQ